MLDMLAELALHGKVNTGDALLMQRMIVSKIVEHTWQAYRRASTSGFHSFERVLQ